MNENSIATSVVNCALEIHKELGSGLLESVYEVLLADALTQGGFRVERQKSIPIHFRGGDLMKAFGRILLWERLFWSS
jgi:GxxExxY protein